MKRTLLILGVIALLVLLGIAAFVGGQLFRAQEPTTANQTSAGCPYSPCRYITPPAALPAEPPTTRGSIRRRVDNSLFICLPNNSIVVNPDGTVPKSAEGGPEVGVVI